MRKKEEYQEMIVDIMSFTCSFVLYVLLFTCDKISDEKSNSMASGAL